VYEYRIRIQTAQNAQDSVLERREVLWSEHERAHAAQAQRAMMGRFLHCPSTCLAIRGEILSAGGFERNRLYVEFCLRFKKSFWRLRGPTWLMIQNEQLGDAFYEELYAHVSRNCLHAALQESLLLLESWDVPQIWREQ
jgi:hypothetical protein